MASISVPTGADLQIEALKECFEAIMGLVPVNLRPGLVLVGGGAVCLSGNRRVTDDLDILCLDPRSQYAFQEAVKNDDRFQTGDPGQWEYSCRGKHTHDVVVKIEFLEPGGASNVDRFVASIADLARLKSIAVETMLEEILNR